MLAGEANGGQVKREDVFSDSDTSKPVGLLRVRVAVEMQGGSIVLEPSSLGGAAFIVRLPREPQRRSRTAATLDGTSASLSPPKLVPSASAP